MTQPDPSTPKNVGKYSMGYCCNGGPNGEKHSEACRYSSPDPSTPARQNYEDHVKQLTFLCDKIDERDAEVMRLGEELKCAREHQLIAVDRYHEIQELKRRNQVLKKAVKLAGDSLALFLSTIIEPKADQVAEENAIKFAYDQGRKALGKLNEIY